MSKREPVCEARASTSYLSPKSHFGKIQKSRKVENLKTLKRNQYRAYKSAFLQEIIPLLAAADADRM